MKSKLLIFLIAILAAFAIYKIIFSEKKIISILVFSKTEGYRHPSIDAGKTALWKMAKQEGFQIDTTENATVFEEKYLKKYNVVVFLNTTGDVLDGAQQLEFQRFIQAGGGFVGIHSAADTEYDWPWYGDLVGAYFKNHPATQEATSVVINQKHDCTKHLPEKWTRTDEWYNYKDIRSHIKVLLNLDESSYKGGENGENHPITWHHEFDGGRSWYTGMGHTDETFAEPAYLKMLLGGIQWSASKQQLVDYNLANVAPAENRFEKVVLDKGLNEPMELEMLPDGRIIFIERHGNIKVYSPEKDTTEIINTLPVFSKLEDGLLGMALDPGFEQNQWIYLYYSPLDVDYNSLSRFDFDGQKLILESEKKILEVVTQRDTCCHSGGSVEFGPDGNLFVSTGDNTNPFESDGYDPIDERKGRKYFDAQRTSGNTADLRGKVLRIHPEADGTYSIPVGNLFPKDGSKGRPEIYAMGCRNPFRIHVDKKTGFLYWGDVGPDAGTDSLGLGSKGHDEVNQAREAGFFGWPYFIGNNKPYHHRNFKTGEISTTSFDVKTPQNNSPNNTGQVDLPPANAAYIWYPYDESKEFPLVEKGGRNAMAGPVFYHADYEENDRRFPQYYDKKFFIYDWMRGWIMAITQDENGGFKQMERFLPSTSFSRPTDMIFSSKGEMYLLEYGTAWNSPNEDARLIHLKYNKGNRAPKIDLTIKKTAGSVPFTTYFNATKTVDFDGDAIDFSWYFDDDKIKSKDAKANYTFKKAGIYNVRLVVKDAKGAQSEETVEIAVGNARPKIEWVLEGNRTFFFDYEALDYEVNITDEEEAIDENRAVVSVDFLEKGYDLNQVSLGHQAQQIASQYVVGKQLIDNSDCRACHAVDKKIAGPSYSDIAKKYKDQPTIEPTLVNRILKGSQGVWGEQAMAAHPQLKKGEAALMIKYILSLTDEQNLDTGLPIVGTYIFDQHQAGTTQGRYILKASYTDNGNDDIPPLSKSKTVVLRPNTIQAIDYDEEKGTETMDIEADAYPGIAETIKVVIGEDEDYLVFKNLDLTAITGIEIKASATSEVSQGGIIRLRLDKPKGKPYAKIRVTPTTTPAITPKRTTVNKTENKHDVYVVFQAVNEGNDLPIAALQSLKFLK